MANLNTVQDHLETLKSGTPEQKKQKLTPESIADVRRFIADERANRANGTHYSLEAQFHEWEDFIKKFETERGTIVGRTQDAVSTTPRSIDVTLIESINILDAEGKNPSLIAAGRKITLTLPPNDKTIEIGGGRIIITEVLVDGKRVWMQKNDIAKYLHSASVQNAPQNNTPSGVRTPDQIRSELDATLGEFSEKDFSSIKNTIEKATKLIEGFEKISPEYREAMRGALGLMLLERFSKAGYRVTLQGNKINITSQKPESTPMATQLETYLRGQSGMNEVLALGMIYRSSEIMRYSEVYLNTDKKSIKPEVPRNYLDYLTDAQVKTRKSQNLNNQALFESRSAIQSILNDSQKVKGIIIGTPFLASAIEAVVADPKMQSEATIAASQLSDGGGNGKSSLTPPLHVPSGPGTLAKLPDWSSDPVNRTLGEIGQGFSGGINKLMSTPGAFGGLLIATIATMVFGGFKKGLMVFGAGCGFKKGLMVFGAGFGLSGIIDRLEKNGFNLGQAAQSAANATTEAATKAKEAVTKAGVTDAPAAGLASVPTNDFQKDLRKMVESSEIATEIDRTAANKNLNKPGKLDDYLKFIESDMKDVPLSKLFPTDHKKSIFFDNFESEYSVDSKLSGKMLKKVLREYLTGNQTLSGNGDKLGEKEQTDFLSLHKITPADIQNKKLSDILESVYKVRTSGAVPAAQPTTPQTPAVAPAKQSPVAPTKHNIAGVDVEVGKNVQANATILTYDDAGKIYENPQSKFPKDKNGKLYIPQDGVVQLGAKTIKVGQVDCVEVKYMGEMVYVPLAFLK